MADYSGIVQADKRIKKYATKRQRRLAVRSIVKQLSLIKDAQVQSRDNIPENFHDSDIYELADENVSLLEEAIELLNSM